MADLISTGTVSTNIAPEKDGLTRLVKSSLNVLWKAKWKFIKLLLLTLLLGGLTFVLSWGGAFLLRAVTPATIACFIAGGVALIVISLMFYGGVQRQAFLAYTGAPEEGVWHSCVNAAKQIFSAIYLSLKIFIYSGFWGVFLVLIGFAVMTTMMAASYYGGADLLAVKVRPPVNQTTTIGGDTGGGPVMADSKAVAQASSRSGFLSATDNPSNGFVSEADMYTSNIAPASEGRVSSSALFLTIGNFVLGALGLVVMIVAMIRMVWVSLAYPILFANPGISAKEAIDTSITATKGKWWLIVLYSLAFSIGIAIISGTANYLLGLFGHTILAIPVAVIAGLLGLAFAMLQMIFRQILAVELKTRGAEYHL